MFDQKCQGEYRMRISAKCFVENTYDDCLAGDGQLDSQQNRAEIQISRRKRDFQGGA
jgi:hypothetical protein